MIYVVAQLRLKPGTTDRACAEARKVVAGTIKEDGCLFYDFNLSVTDETRLVAVERWESHEALAHHNETPHLLAWRKVVAEVALERDIQVITPEKIERRAGPVMA
ncbi:MAG: antibiotic biosynthesis monooxygenase [Pseudolabrys sp.]|nr:antibiotic biosynthesis monooxygenase [Pseudolabrys sp.]MBV9261636.1 antibiotic biosynthesis monooxygenase [Pseudolabrys sp.]